MQRWYVDDRSRSRFHRKVLDKVMEGEFLGGIAEAIRRHLIVRKLAPSIARSKFRLSAIKFTDEPRVLDSLIGI